MTKNSKDMKVWLGVLNDLNNDKEKLASYEEAISKLVESTLSNLRKTIESELVKQVDQQWVSYLDDYDYFDWIPGEFEEHILSYIKDELRKEI